jgi:hypothetical protein
MPPKPRPQTPPLEPIHTAWCSRCEQAYLPIHGINGCTWHDPKYVEPLIIPTNPCACGRQKAVRSARCGYCKNQAKIRPGSRWGKTCACGAPKAGGAVMCRDCRYPVAVVG